MATIVRTQAELDTALADSQVSVIHIESERGVWLHLSSSGSATVRAYGSATVHAEHDSTVTATPNVAVHLHSAQATVTGGVVIDITALDLNDPQTWCNHHGVKVADGRAHLYKAVDSQLTAGRDYGKPTTYTVGVEVTCDDWRDDPECGGGLHVSPRPSQAARYRGGEDGTRFLLVTAPVASLRPIGADKCKVPALHVEAEVDAFARELSAVGGAA